MSQPPRSADAPAGADEGFLSRWSRRKVQVRTGQEPAPAAALTPHSGLGPAVAAATCPAVAVSSSAVVTSEPDDAAAAQDGLKGRPQPDAGAQADTALKSGPGQANVGQQGAAQAAALPPPTMADVDALTPDSDFTRFTQPEVDPQVRNAAMKKLFHSEPQVNVMDGLDVYIDDYNTPDPLPKSMMRMMLQARALGLLDDELTEQQLPDAQGPDAQRPDAQASEAAQPDAQQPAATDLADPAEPQPINAASPVIEEISHENADLQLQPVDAPGHQGLGKGPDTHALAGPGGTPS